MRKKGPNGEIPKALLVFHHSDRDGQYCSHEYQEELTKHNIKPSMADTDVSVDNLLKDMVD